MRMKNTWAAVSAVVVILGGTASITPASAGISMQNTDKTPVLRVPRGGKVNLTYSGVTRIVADDSDVARGSFFGGKAYIEGVTEGETLVTIHQGSGKQLIAVNVVSPDKMTALPVASVQDLPALPLPVPARTAPLRIAAVPAAAAAPVAPAANAANGLAISLRVVPFEENPAQALFTITYSNRGNATAEGVVIRHALDDVVSYVTGSGTGNPTFNAEARELVWKIGSLPAGATGQAISFRVEPIDRSPVSFQSMATIEDSTGVAVGSNSLKYTTNPTPLLTVFAIPDRFLAGRSADVLLDVTGAENQNAVDRLQKMGVVTGRSRQRFVPQVPTQRAEYAVMTLRGLNLRDLRDVTQIKFVLGRRSQVNLEIRNSNDKNVATLVRNAVYEAGERTVVWDGRTGTGYAPPGRYAYVCTAKDTIKGETTVLKGHIQIVPQTPVEPSGRPTFADVKANEWFTGYLAIAEKQDLVRGYDDKTFRPLQPISRVEATAVVVRALGLEDMARQQANVDAGFLDYHDIPTWAVGYVNVASRLAKTVRGQLIMGYPNNFFLPNKSLRRDEAALLVERLLDKETNRSIHLSGQIAPGAAVTIDGKTIQASDEGNFEFVLEQSTSQPITVAVLNLRN